MSSLFVAFVFFLLFLGPTLGQQQQQQPLSSPTEFAALYSLRASLGLRARDWPRKTDPCSRWAGVSCQAGRVVGLDVSGLRRTRLGRLDPRFAVDGLQNLTRLVIFNSTGFALKGAIPDWFGSGLPASVAILDLRRSSITGAIPYSLGNTVSLSVLSLSGNSLTGDIPPTIGQLNNLTVLDLSMNALSGSVPASLGSLKNLTYLDLSSNFLYGTVPPALGMLSSLQTLVLSNNSLIGSVPAQLGGLSSLLSLDLGLNSLSGTLPDDLKNLSSLRVLNLGSNSLSGPLQGSLFHGLSRLQSITLSRNNFSDALPDSLWALSDLRFLDVSYNNLTGTLTQFVGNVNASALAVFNLSHNLYYGSLFGVGGSPLSRFSIVDISDNYFQGRVPFSRSSNASLDFNCFNDTSNQRKSAECAEFYADRGLSYDGSVTPITPNATQPSGESDMESNRRLKYILGGVFGGLGFVALVAVALALCLRRRRGAVKAEQREISANAAPSGGAEPPSGMPVNLAAVGDSYTYEQLLQATSNFGETNLIKHGHSGDIYHGTLEGGIAVAVKKIDVRVKREAYVVELEMFAKSSHTRLVPLLGHCLENEDEKFLVYKFMPNGDLSNALYRKSAQEEEGLQSLDWITRLKIATGVAEALCYLHHECSPPLVHRDVQASSILLDDKFEVRLGSLSEACTQEGDGHQNVITRFLRLSQSSEQGVSGSSSATCSYDVYCLGKVLLELVTGKLGVSGSNDHSTNEWLEQTLPCINIYEKELVTKILDPSLMVDDDLLEEVWAMAIVAKSCLNPKPSKRPLVRYILKALENPLKVVREENSSSARLRTTSSRGSWNAALFASWRQSSSEIVSVSAPPREGSSLKQSGTAGSQGSAGEHSFSHKRPSKEIFPEPAGGLRDIDD